MRKYLMGQRPVEWKERHHAARDHQPNVRGTNELESTIRLSRRPEHANLHGQQYGPHRHEQIGQFESDCEIKIMGGKQQYVADDVQDQAAIDQPEDHCLAIMHWLPETIDAGHEALAHASDDQCREAEQLDVS